MYSLSREVLNGKKQHLSYRAYLFHWLISLYV